MNPDEQEIRRLVANWINATKSGDIDTVLSLMSDDAYFLIPGRPPMDKATFDAISRAQAGPAAPAVEATSDIKEIEIHDDCAFMISYINVTITPANAQSIRRAGHTLTIFKKQNGQWRLFRDANLVVPVAQ